MNPVPITRSAVAAGQKSWLLERPRLVQLTRAPRRGICCCQEGPRKSAQYSSTRSFSSSSSSLAATPVTKTKPVPASSRQATPPSVTDDPSVIQNEISSQVKNRDYASHLASYFYPRHLQRHYLAIRAFNAELASVKEAVSSEILGRIRIGWWRDAIETIFEPKRAPPKHPLVVALKEAVQDERVRASGGLVKDHFLKIVQAREEDLSSPLTPPTLEDLEQYSEWTSSRLYYLSLNLLGVDNRTIDELFSHLGKASGLALLLSSVPFHAGFGPAAAASRQSPSPGKQQGQRQRRLMLPHEYLLEHKVIEEDVYRNGGAARGFKDAVYDTATRANDYIITARTMIRDELGGKVPEAVVGPLVGAVPARYYLEQLEKHDFDPFHPALQSAAAGRDFSLSWAMWRASRKRTI